jgi:hypothetical protein
VLSRPVHASPGRDVDAPDVDMDVGSANGGADLEDDIIRGSTLDSVPTYSLVFLLLLLHFGQNFLLPLLHFVLNVLLFAPAQIENLHMHQ